MAGIDGNSSLGPLLPVTRTKKSDRREKPNASQEKKKRVHRSKIDDQLAPQLDQNEPEQKTTKIDDYV
ncbi:MAG: hypothetical protein L3J28_05265 [Candidatus Polarisedimenticolaceae bacterium]|nr:hypothetical protein [Candidatus Polarisedimenticolaceae bacterium]